jgi:Transposase DDE domain group 1
MPTECTPKLFEFEAVERRSVVAGFDGGNITSNAGALLLGQVDHGLGLVRRFAACFIDWRDPRYVDIRLRRWWDSASSAWRWAKKTSTITMNCARTRRWRCWRAS